jgi:hypothetical protein
MQPARTRLSRDIAAHPDLANCIYLGG